MKNKVALVTGGSRGIGFAAAKELLDCGAKVIILHKNNSIKTKAKFAKEIIADISNEEQVKSAIESVIKEFGRIDILVNNAGIAIDKDFSKRTIKDWKITFETNLFGMFWVSKLVGEVMFKQKTGKIVNISSTNGIDTNYLTSIDYDASKAGVINLTRSLAIQFSPYVNVNCVAPGWVNTDINKDIPKKDLQKSCKYIALGRFAEPKEIAKIISFLASDDASYINGAIIRADGFIVQEPSFGKIN
jgi:3-oxoacyl-[acyl-carrier protein] reductase